MPTIMNINDSAGSELPNLSNVTVSIYGNISTVRTYGLAFRLPLTFAGILTVATTSLALIALFRTKKTPKNVRILSTFLLLFDSLGTVCFAFRRHLSDSELSTSMQIVGVLFIYLAFLTVAIMSVERLIVFQFPNFYMKHATFSHCLNVAVGYYLVSSVIYLFVRIGMCAMHLGSITHTDIMETCQHISFSLFKFTIIAVIIVAFVCYVIIFFIVRKQVLKKRLQNFDSHEKSGTMKGYKSTCLVGVFLANVIFTGLAYFLVVNIEMDLNLVYIMTDVVNLCNNIADTAIYVLWFKECRMQILRMFSSCFPSVTSLTEKMKMDIFDVVTTTTSFGLKPNQPVNPNIDTTREFNR